MNRNRKKFYHLKSIANFIDYYDELSNIQYKSTVYKYLIKYMNLPQDVDITLMESQKHYDEYISPVGKIYHHVLEFSFYISFPSILIFAFIPCLIIFLLQLSVMFYLLVLILVTIWYVPVLRKYKQRKVYGPRF